VAEKNWNEEWEKNYFKPINVDNKCIIHSTFHTDYPEAEYEIIIDPKMAFGTGHHATTSQMVSGTLGMDLKGKSVLDMGCGTGVLAMLASMKGAEPILAIDIDSWSYDNTLENMSINNIDNIEVKCGDASLLTEGEFDVILANINRNILLNDMPTYVARLNKGGELLMSGFYSEDLHLIQNKAKELGLTYAYHKVKDDWTVVNFYKE
jgi:ribosomal protein L11 methyltransferase